ncbi:MAG TPA: hypothetical protein VJ853_01765 [Thermoanaerobaculia bacterium]|nr:hypothetical protein [Thermoanaerobaculia bacterium]
MIIAALLRAIARALTRGEARLHARFVAQQVVSIISTLLIVQAGEISEADLEQLRQRYFLRPTDDVPRADLRLTDNWIEVTVRFIVREYGIREVKNPMSHDILDAFEKQGIQVASSTMDVTLVGGS